MFDLRSVRVMSADSRWKGGKMRERRCCSFVKPAVSASPSSKRSLSSSLSLDPFICLTNLVHRPGGFSLTQSFQAFSSSSLPKLFSPFPSLPTSHISTVLWLFDCRLTLLISRLTGTFENSGEPPSPSRVASRSGR